MCVAVKVVQNFVLQIFEETAMLGNFQTKFPIVRLIHIPPPPITRFDDFNESHDIGKRKATVQSAL